MNTDDALYQSLDDLVRLLKSRGIYQISWNGYNDRWSASVVRGFHRKHAQFVGYERPTLKEAVDDVIRDFPDEVKAHLHEYEQDKSFEHQ